MRVRISGHGGKATPTRPSRGIRHPEAVCALALLAYLVACLTAWVEPTWWPEWDSALYILTGRSLAQGEGYTYLDRPFMLRPPGLAWLISLVLPDGHFDPLALNRTIMLFAGACVAAIYFALRAVSARWIALGVALLAGTNWLVASRFNRVESEFPFTALLFLAIGLFHRIDATRRGWLAALASGLCLAGALYVRTAGLVLVPGLVALGAAAAPGLRWRRLLPAALAVLLLLPWIHYARGAAALAERPAEQLQLFDYATAILYVDAGDPDSALVPLSGWWERIRANAREILRDLAGALLGSGHALAQGLLAALWVGGALRAWRARPSLLEWFAATYLALLLVYFTHHRRLLLPLLPVVYLHLLAAVEALAARLAGPRPLASKLALGGVAAGLLAVNLSQWPGPRELPEAWQYAMEVSERVKRVLPPDAVLMADAAPVFAVLTERRVYTFRHPRGSNLLDRYEPDLLILHFDHPSTESAKPLVAGAEKKRWIPSRRFTRDWIQGYEPHDP